MTVIAARRLIKVVVAAALLAAAAQPAVAQKAGQPPGPAQGSLGEISRKRRAMLLVISPATVDARDPTAGVVEAIRSGRKVSTRHRRVFNAIAKKLNKYMDKYGSMTAVEDPGEADFFIVFNLLRYRRMLNGFYPYGEMMVIAGRAPAPERVLWKTDREMFVEDAANDMLKAIKASRGEK